MSEGTGVAVHNQDNPLRINLQFNLKSGKVFEFQVHVRESNSALGDFECELQRF